MNFLKKLGNFESLLTFLIMELLAITAFMLGNANSVFFIVGALLTVFSGLMLYNRFSKNELPSLAFIFLPILLISIFASFGNFSSGAGVLVNILTFLGINAFFLLGLFTRRIQKIDLSKILICIYAGFSLVVLISLFYTWARYGLFYTLIYKDTPTYYYDGQLFNITIEQGWLSGLSFKEVSLQYSGLFGVILCTALVPLIYLSPKKNKIEFIIYAVISFIGVLSIVSSPNLEALLYLIPIAFIGLIIRLLHSEKINEETKKTLKKVLYIGFVCLVIIVLVFFVLALLNASGYNQAIGYTSELEPISGFSQFIKNNWFLNKLFNNGRIMAPINKVLNQATVSFNLFGFLNDGNMHPATELAIQSETHMFEIELIKEGGIFAFIVLFALIIFMSQNIIRYFHKSKDANHIKATIITLVIVIFIYESFSHSSFPIIHEPTSYNSFMRSLPCSIFLFLLGIIFYPQLKKDEIPMFEKEIKIEKVKKEEQPKIVDDEYTFTIDSEEEDK